MRHMSEPLTPSARFLHDAGTLALLALVLIPLYLLLNQYWQSLILLVIFYGLLCSFCTRLGNYTVVSCGAYQPKSRRGTRSRQSRIASRTERHFSAADAIQSVRRTRTMCRKY